MPDIKPKQQWATIILFLLSLLILSIFNFLPDPNFLPFYIILFLISGGFHFSLIQNDILKKNMVLIFFISIIIKLIHLSGTPFLSNDIYRYVFDGQMITSGFNPYSYSPKVAIELGLLGTDYAYYHQINHPELSTIYLIIPEFIFGLSSLSVNVRLFFLVIELGFLWMIFRYKKERFSFYLLISLHPLLVIETYATGHFDFLMLYLVALMYEFSDRALFQRLFYFLSVLTKGFSLFFLKINRKHLPYLLLGMILLISNIMLITASPSDGFSTYHETFSFNNPIYEYLNTAFQKEYHDIQAIISYALFNKLLTLLIVLIISLLSLWKYRHDPKFLGLLFSSIFIFGSATIHPWYLLIMIYFAFEMNLKTLLFLTYSIFISYVVLIDFKLYDEWNLESFFFWFIYAPFVIKLCILVITKSKYLYNKCLQYFSRM